MPESLTVSVVVPCYNSEGSLPLLVARVEEVLSPIGTPFEMVLVEDGSSDGTWEVICGLARRHQFVRGLRLMRNYGQHNALLCGIRAARNEVVVTMDDDLQNPPEEIPGLLGKLGAGCDVVYGTPARETHGLVRDVASRITKIVLQRSMGAETARNISAFRAFRTQLREAFRDYRGSFVSIDVLLTWGARRFASVVVRNDPRRIGVTNYSFWRLFVHAMNMMTGFSTLPLQLASFIGVGVAVFGFVVLIYVLGRYLIQGGSVPGFAFLASTIAIFSGAQLLALGIIGEYLARVHARTMDRPSFTVRTTTDVETQREG